MEPIRSIYENDPDMADLVRSFAAEAPNRAQLLEDLLAEGQLDELQRIAHQLKGAGGGYGFSLVTDVSARLEEALKEGASESVIKERTSTVCDVLRAVRSPEAE
jgi:HPt (histidine-containing phosphotransfer) domain-containing protein